MGEDLAATNVNRSYALAATNVAFFTFMLFFLYPRFENGRINPLLFQSTLVAMGVLRKSSGCWASASLA
jgi:neutral trehalase